MKLQNFSFRLFDVKENKYVSETIIFHQYKKVYSHTNTHRRNIEHCIIEFSTGIKDKDGKEIFAGDILEYQKDDKCLKFEAVCSLKRGFSISPLGFIVDKNKRDNLVFEAMKTGVAKDCEVISNIHELGDE